MPAVKIKCQYLTDVTWNDTSGCDFGGIDFADVWRVNISSNVSHLNRFANIINAEETARGKRYLHMHDRHRFIISRGALRTILSRYSGLSPAEIEFGVGENKKPFISNLKGSALLQYNVSHSGDWILIGVSNFAIGVDTEQINPSFEFRDVVKDYFSDEEISYINQDNGAEHFFKLWTRKEALTKATAKGLDEDLKIIPSLDGEHLVEASVLKSIDSWLVSSFQLTQNYLGCVACNMALTQIRFWDFAYYKTAN